MNKRIVAYDYMRVISMCGVIMIHLFSKKDVAFVSASQEMVYDIILRIMNFAVPIFVMISGALILCREESYKSIFKRCRRLLYALLLFGLPAAVLENEFHRKSLSFEILIKSIADVISGHSWAVFWFIYMLIGLYLMFPILQRGFKNNRKATLIFALLLYIFTAVIPLLNQVAHEQIIGFYLPVSSVYLLYAVMGYVISNLMDGNFRKKLCVPSAVYVFLYVLIIILNGVLKLDIGEIIEQETFLSLFVFSVFILAYELCKRENKFIIELSKCSVGVYLVHCFFVNFIYKFLDITPIDFPLCFSIPILFVVVLTASYLTTKLLRMIPIIKNHIL